MQWVIIGLIVLVGALIVFGGKALDDRVSDRWQKLYDEVPELETKGEGE